MEPNYQIAWTIYLVSVAVAQWLLWLLIRPLSSKDTKQVIQLCVFALLITPIPLEPGDLRHWVPAFMAALMEAIDTGINAALNRLWPALVLMLVLLLSAMAWRLHRQGRRGTETDAA